MFHVLQSIIDRVKAMFTLDAALDLEQEFLARQAERKAALMRRADEFENEGLNSIAADLRRQAESLSERRPLQTVFAFLDADDAAEKKRQAAALALGDDRIGFRSTAECRRPCPLPTPKEREKMLTISRKLIRTLRSVFRKVGVRADRLKTALVAFRSEGDSVRIQCRCDDFAAEYQLAEAQPHEAFRLPLAAFADCEGGKETPVHFRLEGNDVVVAEWVDGGVPQIRRYSVTQDDAIWFERPSSMSPANDPALCATLAEVVESTGSHVRFATHCVQLRGQKGEAVGTDGRQLLIVRGLRFPWDDDILVPRTPIFACREFAAAGTLELGRSDSHCVFRAGPWTVWLPIAKNQRYPNFEQTIPGPHLAKTRLVAWPRRCGLLGACSAAVARRRGRILASHSASQRPRDRARQRRIGSGHRIVSDTIRARMATKFGSTPTAAICSAPPSWACWSSTSAMPARRLSPRTPHEPSCGCRSIAKARSVQARMPCASNRPRPRGPNLPLNPPKGTRHR